MFSDISKFYCPVFGPLVVTHDVIVGHELELSSFLFSVFGVDQAAAANFERSQISAHPSSESFFDREPSLSGAQFSNQVTQTHQILLKF